MDREKRSKKKNTFNPICFSLLLDFKMSVSKNYLRVGENDFHRVRTTSRRIKTQVNSAVKKKRIKLS